MEITQSYAVAGGLLPIIEKNLFPRTGKTYSGDIGHVIKRERERKLRDFQEERDQRRTEGSRVIN